MVPLVSIGKVMNKLLTIGIIALFIGSTSSSIGFNLDKHSVTRNIITVDDEGDGDYTNIQDAVDNATEGDTILVYSGNYSEIWIYNYNLPKPIKRITIKGIPYELGAGNDVGKPLIAKENGRLIYLYKTKECIIDGFELINGFHGFLLIDSSNNSIKNNTIKSCHIGIELEGSSNNNILEENQIISCSYKGIFIESTSNNIIKKNIIEKCNE
jgi:parallel beta-helix repeat protein